MNNTLIYLIALMAFELAWFLPFRSVFRQAHFHPGYAYLSLVPILGPLACIWILSTKRWPLKNRLVKTYN